MDHRKQAQAEDLSDELKRQGVGETEFWLASLLHTVGLQLQDQGTSDARAAEVRLAMRTTMARCAQAFVMQEGLSEQAVSTALDLFKRTAPTADRPRYLS